METTSNQRARAVEAAYNQAEAEMRTRRQVELGTLTFYSVLVTGIGTLATRGQGLGGSLARGLPLATPIVVGFLALLAGLRIWRSALGFRRASHIRNRAARELGLWDSPNGGEAVFQHEGKVRGDLSDPLPGWAGEWTAYAYVVLLWVAVSWAAYASQSLPPTPAAMLPANLPGAVVGRTPLFTFHLRVIDWEAIAALAAGAALVVSALSLRASRKATAAVAKPSIVARADARKGSRKPKFGVFNTGAGPAFNIEYWHRPAEGEPRYRLAGCLGRGEGDWFDTAPPNGLHECWIRFEDAFGAAGHAYRDPETGKWRSPPRFGTDGTPMPPEVRKENREP